MSQTCPDVAYTWARSYAYALEAGDQAGAPRLILLFLFSPLLPPLVRARPLAAARSAATRFNTQSADNFPLAVGRTVIFHFGGLITLRKWETPRKHYSYKIVQKKRFGERSTWQSCDALLRSLVDGYDY